MTDPAPPAPFSFREQAEIWLRTLWARAYVRIVGQNREPSWVIFDITLPVIYLMAYCFLYRSMNSGQVLLGYLILGGAMVSFWMNVLWGMATVFYWEKEMGNLELFFLAPTSRMAVLMGMAIGGMYSTTVRSLASFILGSWIFGVPFQVSSWGALFGIFLLTLAALYGLGMIGSSLFLLMGRRALYIAELLHEPVFFLSGYYFPVRILGYAVAGIAALLPITLGMDGMRQVIYGSIGLSLLPVGTEILLLLLLTVLYIAGARVALAWMEERAKRQGRLGLRWL